MAAYPGAVYAPRTKENKAGIVYDAAKKTIGYVEDITKLDDEIVAVETELGIDPRGDFADVAARLAALVPYTGADDDLDLGVFDLITTGDVLGGRLIIETNTLYVDLGHTGIGTNNPTKRLSVVSSGTPADDEVRFFYDPPTVDGNPDVGNEVDGPSFYVYRRAPEGDDYLRLYIQRYRTAAFVTPTQFRFYNGANLRLLISSGGIYNYVPIRIPSDANGIFFGAGADWDIYSNGTDFIIDRNVGGGFVVVPNGRIRQGQLSGQNNYIEMWWNVNGYIATGAGDLRISAVVGSDIVLGAVLNYIKIPTIRSGATQVAAGAAATELWKTNGHATLPDNVVMIGV